MKTLDLDRDEFAANRKGVLDRGDDTLRPEVVAALANFGQGSWWEPLVAAARGLALASAKDESDADPTVLADLIDETSFAKVLTDALKHTSAPTGTPDQRAAQVETITRWLSTASVNAGTSLAASLDTQVADMEWVTMHDDKVRASHKEVDGRTAAIGATFTVAGYELHHPGEPVGPPEVWINCRCVLRPTLGDAMSAVTDFAAQTTAPPLDPSEVDDEVDPEAPEIPDDVLTDVPLYGVLAPEGVPTGDKRGFDPGSLRYRDLPLPLRWQKIDQPGHDGSVVVGRIDKIWLEDGLHKFEGTGANTPEADEAIGLIADRMMRGVSVDLDDVTKVELRNADGTPWQGYDMAEGGSDTADQPEPVSWVTDGRIASAAIVSIPAFQEAFVAIGTWDTANDAPHDPPVPMMDEPMEPAASEEVIEFAISEAAWNGSASRFNDAQWKASCVLDRGEEFTTAKTRYALPIKEPNGDLSRAGVHAAAGRLDQVDAPDAAKSAARSKLAAAYQQLDEEPPEGLAASAAEYAPGTHDGPGWITNPRATERIRRYWVHGKGAAKIKWGVPHDFYRCRRQLAKYVQNPSWLNGLCANMHKEALGFWPGGEDNHHALQGDPGEAFNIVECGDCLDSLAASGGKRPPLEWFIEPDFTGPTPVEVTEDGRIFGHIATWGTCHIGIKGVCATPPHSLANYAYYRLGSLLTDGGPIPVGHITMGTGHADLSLNAAAAMAHYDDTGAVVADVASGEDEYGIWIAGALRNDLTEDDIVALRSATLSGDWRRIGDHLEMVAALAVNVPGFPIPRLALAASGAEQRSLVASGIVRERKPADAVAGSVYVNVVPLVDAPEFVDAIRKAVGMPTVREEKMSQARQRVRQAALRRARGKVK